MKMYVVVINDDSVIGVYDSLEKAHDVVEKVFDDIPYEIQLCELNSINQMVVLEEGYGKAER